MPWFVPLVVAYLAGSIPFGLLVARARGFDIRKHGSGNIGATNVFRVVGKPYGIAVFVLDFLKGLGPVLWAQHGGFAPEVAVGAALAAILGHNFPVWLGFRGGKGIATSAGALAALFPVPLAVGLAVWLLLFKTTRYVSVASMGAAAAIPLVLIAQSLAASPPPWVHHAFAWVVAGLAIWRHRSNLRSLRAGTEHRFGSKPKSP